MLRGKMHLGKKGPGKTIRTNLRYIKRCLGLPGSFVLSECITKTKTVGAKKKPILIGVFFDEDPAGEWELIHSPLKSLFRDLHALMLNFDYN